MNNKCKLNYFYNNCWTLKITKNTKASAVFFVLLCCLYFPKGGGAEIFCSGSMKCKFMQVSSVRLGEEDKSVWPPENPPHTRTHHTVLPLLFLFHLEISQYWANLQKHCPQIKFSSAQNKLNYNFINFNCAF